MSGLAAALQAAKLKKTNGPKSAAGAGGSAGDVSNGNGSNYGTVGRQTSSSSGSGGGMASMMDEMQKTLARRRAKVDRSSEEPEGEGGSNYAEGGKGSSPGKATSTGSESPKPENHSASNGNSGDMEAMKQEILREMRKEIGKAKQEIIDVIRAELARK